MYLLYCDESGDLGDPNVNAFVVAGIAVHEDAVRPLAGEVQGIMRQYLGRDLAPEIETHGNPMRTGNAAWNGISVRKRIGLYNRILDLICEWTHDGSGSRAEVFATAIENDHSQSPTETSYGELLYAFDQWLRDNRRAGNPHNGVLVADRSRYEKTLRAWVEVARAFKSRPAQDPRRLHALVETPFFVDSESTRLMQLADLVAHALYRSYNSGDERLAQRIRPALDGAGRLAHFTSDKACRCQACVK